MKPHGVFGGTEGSGAESGSPASPVAEGLLYTVSMCMCRVYTPEYSRGTAQSIDSKNHSH